MNTFPTPDRINTTPALTPPLGYTGIANCYADGKPRSRVKKELAGGPVITSLVGYTLSYNSLDNNRNPTSGMLTEFRQDFAGVGGNVNFIRTSSDLYSYREVVSDVISIFHLQGGAITGWGSKDLRMLDHFQMGPNLVRGFATSGFGPRDITQLPYTGIYGDALGGTYYWGASLSCRRRCTSCRRTPASRSLPSPMRARSGTTPGRPPSPRPARCSPAHVSVLGPPERRQRSPMSGRQRHERALVGRRGLDLGLAVRAAAVRLFVPTVQAIL